MTKPRHCMIQSGKSSISLREICQMSHRTGLAVMRLQPLHEGHLKIINKMISSCQTAIIGLDSAQKSREKHDPWTVEERMTMIRNVYGDRVKIVPLNDLGASRPEEWVQYIFEKLSKLGLKEPTDYFTGSLADSVWYKFHFATGDYGVPTCYNKNGFLRKLHIIPRDQNPVPAATEIR